MLTCPQRASKNFVAFVALQVVVVVLFEVGWALNARKWTAPINRI
jgi:hypothetical protein